MRLKFDNVDFFSSELTSIKFWNNNCIVDYERVSDVINADKKRNRYSSSDLLHEINYNLIDCIKKRDE